MNVLDQSKKQISSMKKISVLQDVKNLACVVEFLLVQFSCRKMDSPCSRELHFNRRSDQVDGKCNEHNSEFQGLVDYSFSCLAPVA